MNSPTTTFNLSDAIEMLIHTWNTYSMTHEPNTLMNGMGICLGLTASNEGNFTDEEVEFVNMYIDECSSVFSDDPGDDYDC
jgi:hypothetical protein|tara:strand:- start:1692 stop:1934 length:243 start_codon:yes stop_codon:yes gene_type:complete